MGGMGGGMGGNTMMDNGMMGSIPSLMETSGSRSMGGRGDHRGDVRDQFTMLLDFFQGMYNTNFHRKIGKYFPQFVKFLIFFPLH